MSHIDAATRIRMNNISAAAFRGVTSRWMKLVRAGMPVDECEKFMVELIKTSAGIREKIEKDVQEKRLQQGEGS